MMVKRKMKPEKRTEKRVPSIFAINIKHNDRFFSGISQNISKNGIYVEAIEMKRIKNREISLTLAIDRKLYQLKGEVKWTRSLASKKSKKALIGMGIRLSEAPADYLNYVEYIKRSSREIH